MSRKENCWAIPFSKALQTPEGRMLVLPEINKTIDKSRAQSEKAVFENVEAWYNTFSRHSTIGYEFSPNPQEFENPFVNIKLVG